LEQSKCRYAEEGYITAAHLAAGDNSHKVLKLLGIAGADFNKPDLDGLLPFHRAAQDGNLDTTHYFIENFPNPFIKDKNNHSPFYYACEQGHWETAALFLKKVCIGQLSKEDRDLIKQHEEKLGQPNYVDSFTPSVTLSNSLIQHHPDLLEIASLESKAIPLQEKKNYHGSLSPVSFSNNAAILFKKPEEPKKPNSEKRCFRRMQRFCVLS
jgi:ankyrin repeat protein